MPLLRQNDSKSLVFLLVIFLTGIAVALQFSTLSLFLANDINANSLLIGLFYAVNAVAGILVSQLLASYSDNNSALKQIIISCCIAGVLMSTLFAFNRNYWLLLIFGVLLSSIASTTSPLLFAHAREYTKQQKKDSNMFITVMRSLYSLAWVVGPPISFVIAIDYGFFFLYLVATIMFLFCTLVVMLKLPKSTNPKFTQAHKINVWENRDVRLLFTASTLMWTSNNMYRISMPLYVFYSLHLNEKLAGIMMGIAACVEIPAMLVSGYYTRKIGKHNMMLISASAGILFYGGLLYFHTQNQLLEIQLFCAMFVGILASTGMCYFQDLLGHAPCIGTTLYSNTMKAGAVISGVLSGVVTKWFGFHGVFETSLLLIIISLICLSKMDKGKCYKT
ncbi:sugar efflux transporter [Piscirickettsia litoralis]|uniref:sugar efflux transporter n=1 Tax=Piscirickettsia litoralis TaxID=1891921 RepID=UPI001F328FEF|nr:sugar efflux transporter [Piscirickettsia litoralis]